MLVPAKEADGWAKARPDVSFAGYLVTARRATGRQEGAARLRSMKEPAGQVSCPVAVQQLRTATSTADPSGSVPTVPRSDMTVADRSGQRCGSGGLLPQAPAGRSDQ